VSVAGEWKGETAGGCLNNPFRWRSNKQYALSVYKDMTVSIRLKQAASDSPKSIGFYVFTGGKRVIKAKKDSLLKKSKFGKHKEGMTETLKLTASPDVPYIIVPCTIEADQEGEYVLSVLSDDANFIINEECQVELYELPEEFDLDRMTAKGEWTDVTAGGCLDYATWRNNPQFLLDVGKTCDLNVFLTCHTEEDITPGFYVVKAPTNMTLRVDLKKEDVLFKAPFTTAKEITKSFKLTPGRYNIIPCTYTTGLQAEFSLTVFSSSWKTTNLSEIKAGLITLHGEWTDDNAGGCINDMKSWLTNPRFFLGVKQHTEIAVVLVQEPSQPAPANLNDLLDIGMYITNSDGDGNPKTDEAKDLIAKANFSPDKDVVSVTALPPCHWPYVLTPSTFKPGIKGKFAIHILCDYEDLEYIEFKDKNFNINPSEVVGAGEDPRLREIKRRFKPLAAQTVELVRMTEVNPDEATDIPEFMTYCGRQLLSKVAEYQASIIAWAAGEEPQWWLDGYPEDEEIPEEPAVVEETPADGGMKRGGAPPPPPPPKGRPPPINFSKPPIKLEMIDTSSASSMTTDMIEKLEAPKERLFVDELLIAVKGGIKNLRKVEIPPKPVVKDPYVCAFDMELLNKRRAAIEGLHDKEEDDWSNDGWDD